jgi:hypothetical protein
MNIYDACELAYKNGYEAGRNSMANQCVMCGAEMPEGGHICTKCMDGAVQPKPLDIPLAQVVNLPAPNTELSFGSGDENYDFLVYYRRAKPLNRFQIWMYKICFGIRARNI